MVDIVKYRQAVGSFVAKLHSKSAVRLMKTIYSLKCICLYSPQVSIIVALLLLCCGDIHPHPGPKYFRGLRIIHLNVRSLKEKLDLLVSEFRSYDVICLSENW